MRITFEDIALRDMQESDIEDYVRWFTTETKWNDYDVPWESIEDPNEESQRTSWREYYEWIKDAPEDRIRWKFEIEWNGRHNGWVSSYLIDDNYEWVGKIKEGQTIYRAVGIDICESDAWSRIPAVRLQEEIFGQKVWKQLGRSVFVSGQGYDHDVLLGHKLGEPVESFFNE